MIRSLVLYSFAAATLAALSPAQMIRMVGTVQQTPAGYSLSGTDAELVSVGVDLATLLGDDVDLTGMLQPGSNPPRVGVVTAEQSTSWFRIQGSNRIGDSFVLRIDDPDAVEYYTFVSLRRGFVPLDPITPVVHGTLFLDFSLLFNVAWGHMDNSWREIYPIPNDASLVGLSLHMQSAVLQSQGELLYTNAETLTIQAQ